MTIDKFMETVPLRWRYHWCNAEICCCLGCINKATKFFQHGFTKEDWQKWVERNPKPDNFDELTKPVVYGKKD